MTARSSADDHPGPGDTGDERWTFGLLASAVAGRSVPIATTDSPLAYSDGSRLHLPENASAHTVMVQAAMLAAGSLEPPGVRLLVGRRGTADRYVALESSRAVQALRALLPAELVARASDLHPGPPTSSAAESLERARSTGVPAAPAWCGTVRPLSLRRPGDEQAADVSDGDLRDALRTGDALEELSADDDAGERSRFLELLAVPLSNPLATKMAKLLGMGTAPGSSGAGGQEFTVRGSRAGTGLGQGRRVPAGRVPRPTPSRPDRAAGWHYDEWSSVLGRYRHSWCTVAELLPDTSVAVEPRTGDTDVRLLRQLARLGLTDARHRRRPEGDTLDITGLVDYAVDRRLGSADDPRVYEIRRRTHRDLGVVILLDASGSTGDRSGDHEVFDAQRELTARLTAALDELGDRVATYAFYSRGRSNVRFLRIKDFDDRYGHAARLRLAALTPGGYTRLGAAVRHATHVVTTKAGTASTLLVVIGDGLPYDDGYEHRYAQQDARRALTEAVERGVGCACISLRSSTRPDIRDAVWGHVAHRALDRPQDLASHVRPLFRSALTAAHASRRPVVPGSVQSCTVAGTV